MYLCVSISVSECVRLSPFQMYFQELKKHFLFYIYSILFYSILFYSILFYSINFIPISSILFCQVLLILHYFTSIITSTFFICIRSENISKRFQISRHDQDDFAFNSHKKAAKSKRSKQFSLEIVPVGSVNEDDGK